MEHVLHLGWGDHGGLLKESVFADMTLKQLCYPHPKRYIYSLQHPRLIVTQTVPLCPFTNGFTGIPKILN